MLNIPMFPVFRYKNFLEGFWILKFGRPLWGLKIGKSIGRHLWMAIKNKTCGRFCDVTNKGHVSTRARCATPRCRTADLTMFLTLLQDC